MTYDLMMRNNVNLAKHLILKKQTGKGTLLENLINKLGIYIYKE